jgi:hypothetical protein
MFTKRVSVLIARPIEDVFEFLGTSGPFPTTLAYLLGERDGKTAVDFSVTGRPSGPLRLFQPTIARNTRRNLDRGFTRLKQLLEGTA